MKAIHKKPQLFIITLVLLSIFSSGNCQTEYLSQIGIHETIYSEILDESRDFWVQMPENYNPENHSRYPLVFILDGGEHLKAVSTVLDYYYGGFIPEMILVAISNRENRNRDLRPEGAAILNGNKSDQKLTDVEKFTMFLHEELIPYINNNYPATDFRTLIGHSYGGLFTLNVLLKHPDLFSNYLAIDPSLNWDDQNLLDQYKNDIATLNIEGKSLYVSLSGQMHLQNNGINISNVRSDTSSYTLFTRSILEFCELIEQSPESKINFKWELFPSDIHATVPLPSILNGLIFLFNWYTIENTDRFNTFDTPLDELIGYIKYREKKLRDHFGYFVPPFEEELFSMLGYMNMEMGEQEKALAFFQMALEFFPLSPNACIAMADFYESQEDYINALKFVEYASGLTDNNSYSERIQKLQLLISE